MDDLISRRAAVDAKNIVHIEMFGRDFPVVPVETLKVLPPVDAVPVVRCKDCKHNPKIEWFGCPMASLSEKQRPETAWCWKGERKDDDNG